VDALIEQVIFAKDRARSLPRQGARSRAVVEFIRGAALHLQHLRYARWDRFIAQNRAEIRASGSRRVVVCADKAARIGKRFEGSFGMAGFPAAHVLGSDWRRRRRVASAGEGGDSPPKGTAYGVRRPRNIQPGLSPFSTMSIWRRRTGGLLNHSWVRSNTSHIRPSLRSNASS